MAGTLKTPFDNAVYPTTGDLSGDLATSRGDDPLAAGDNGQPAAIQDFWESGPYPWPSGVPEQAITEDGPIQAHKESPNSVSGLPPLPNRYVPTVEAPTMPDLTDRQPGTIDKQ